MYVKKQKMVQKEKEKHTNQHKNCKRIITNYHTTQLYTIQTHSESCHGHENKAPGWQNRD